MQSNDEIRGRRLTGPGLSHDGRDLAAAERQGQATKNLVIRLLRVGEADGFEIQFAHHVRQRGTSPVFFLRQASQGLLDHFHMPEILSHIEDVRIQGGRSRRDLAKAQNERGERGKIQPERGDPSSQADQQDHDQHTDEFKADLGNLREPQTVHSELHPPAEEIVQLGRQPIREAVRLDETRTIDGLDEHTRDGLF